MTRLTWLGRVVFVLFWTAGWTGMFLAFIAMGWQKPATLESIVLQGVIVGFTMMAFELADQRGWIRPGLFSPRPELEKRKAELEAERERLLADARAKAQAAANSRGGIEPRRN